MTQGTQVRDFIHVNEAAAAVLEVLKRRTQIPYGFTSVDVGTGTGTSLRSFAEAAVRISGAPTRLQFGSLPSRTSEPPELVANTGPLERLGWSSGVDIERGLKSVFEGCER
jgi:GDP-4-dehydro-6-deoxy-D-mannose reductase